MVQAPDRRPRQGAVGRGAGGALPPAARACARVRAGRTRSPDDELDGTEQPFVSHLVELRDRLIRAAIAVGVCFGVLSVFPGPGALYDLLAAPLVRTCPRAAR